MNSPRAISLFITIAISPVIVGVWMANRPLPVPSSIDGPQEDALHATDEVPANEMTVDDLTAHIQDVPVETKSSANDDVPLADTNLTEGSSVEDVPEAEPVDVPSGSKGIDSVDTLKTDVVAASRLFDSTVEMPATDPVASSVEHSELSKPIPVDDAPGDNPVPDVDVATAMQTKVARWEQARSIPLIEILDQFEEMVGGKIVLDEFDSPEMQQRLSQPVSFAYRQKTFTEILTGLLDDAGLRFEIHENKIRISPTKP